MQPFQENPRELDGVPDLCLLNYLQEPNVLHNLRYRYKEGKIYTSTTSKVLVAVNPYEVVPGTESDTTMARYQNAAVNLEGLMTGDGLEPHVFTVAHGAYHNMASKRENQSVIVCGESGSGKTESAKLFMKFLAYTSTQKSTTTESFFEASQIGKQILDANPILESFGNAQTVLNDNSSRFGKFTKMLFQPEHANLILRGAVIETYLLERSRVVRQDPGERNYHCFFYLLANAAQHPTLELGSGDAKEFHYVRGNAVSKSDVAHYNELVQAMNTLNFSKEDQASIFRNVAGILHLGNVAFEDGPKVETCTVRNSKSLEIAARLLQVDAEKLKSRLTSRTITLRNQTIVKPLAREAAKNNRDSIAKALYNGLFLWIVERINKESSSPIDEHTNWIGTLDVFGFEIFENNSFEQFCINFANERLQQFFNYHVLKMEQDLYRREALLWNPIDLPENQDVIELIAARPYGILPILDSACQQPQGNDEIFMQNVLENNRQHVRMQKVNHNPKRKDGAQFAAFNGFLIKHYAGPVTYDAKEFLVKNMDSAHPDTISLFCTSTCSITSEILTLREGNERFDLRDAKGGQKFKSTSFVFNEQLVALMATLSQTTPYFVRCIKPNSEKAPRRFVSEYVLPQLRCGGLVEALRIIKCGFPTRCSYERMHSMFGQILDGFRTVTNLNKRDFTEAMIMVCGDQKQLPDRSQYQLGLTMIFFRPGKQAFFQKILSMDPASISMQQRVEIHKFLIQKRIVRMRGSIKAALRIKHILLLQKFQKAANVMRTVAKTFVASLHRVRKIEAHRRSEEEKVRLAKDVQYQQGLRAIEELDKMKQQEAQLHKAIEAEREKTQKSEAQMATLLAKIKVLNGELATVQQDAAAQKAQLEQTIQEGAKKLQAALAEKTTGQGELGKTKRALEDVTSALQQAKEEVAEKQKTIAQSRQAEQELNAKLSAAKEEAHNFASQIAVLKKAKMEVEVQLQQQSASAEGTKATLTEKEALVDELKASMAQLAQLRIEEARVAQKRIETALQTSEADLQALHVRTEEEISDLRRRLSTQHAEKLALEKELEEMTSKCSRYEEDIARQTRERAEADEISFSKIASKEEEIAALQEACNKVLEETRAARDETQQLELEHQSLVKQRTRELAEWEAKYQRSKLEAEETVLEVKKSMQQAHELEMDQVKAQLESITKQLAKAQEKFAAETAKREQSATREAELKNRELEEANNEVNELKARVARFQAQIAELTEKHRLAEQALAQKTEEQVEESARLNRKVASVASQVAGFQERVSCLEEQLVQARTLQTSLEEKHRRELASLRANFEEEVHRATALQDRSARQIQQLEQQLDEQRETAQKEIQAVTFEMKVRERKNQEETAELTRKLAAATRQQAASTEGAEEWERERAALIEKVTTEADRGMAVSRELAQALTSLALSKKTLDAKQQELEETKAIYEQKLADQDNTMRQMQSKFDRCAEDAQTEAQGLLTNANNKMKSLQAELDSAVARELSMKAELDTVRDELTSVSQQNRLFERNYEAKMEAQEQQFKLQARKAELEFEKKLRAIQSQLQEAQEHAHNSDRAHRMELEAAEERIQQLRTSLQRDFACEQVTLKAQLSNAEERHQEIKDKEESWRQRELNFEHQIEELTKALLESKQAVRDLTAKHEGVVADLARERANLPIQMKVLRMEMASKVEVAALEHQRLLSNAQAENTVLQTRLNRLMSTSGRPAAQTEKVSRSETPPPPVIHVETDTENLAVALLSPEPWDDKTSFPAVDKATANMSSPRKPDLNPKMASPNRKVLKERTKSFENQENVRVIRM